jgi:hypothetical protein
MDENPSASGLPAISGLARAFSAMPFIIVVFPVPAPPIALAQIAIGISRQL